MTEVAVHFADPETWDSAALDAGTALLSAAERERARAFRFERDRRLYVVAHALLRRVLARDLHATPEALAFRQNEHGRPELEPESRIRFSLSHTHGMAVCAVTRDHDVGVDVEPLDRPVSLAVAERFFAEPEVADVRSAPERFLTYWTLKEAYVKARGVGLGLGVRNVAFALSEAAVRFCPGAHVESEPEAWSFHPFQLGPRHQCALAVRAKAASVAVHAFRH